MITNTRDTAPARRTRWGLLIVVAVLLVLGGLGWLERNALLGWYYLANLAAAGDADRAVWAERVAELDEEAVPGLFDGLSRDAEGVCVNYGAGLAALLKRWGPADDRTYDLCGRLPREFAHFSAAGRRAVLGLARQAPRSATALLAVVPPCDDGGVLNAALDLCGDVLAHAPSAEETSAAREVVHDCLRATDPGVRVRAVRLALKPGLELLEPVAALLGDPVAEVRRAAVLAVGPADKEVLDETLLPCLRDPDPEVRRLCEAALRGRGLSDDHLRLSRLLVDPAPSVRLQVLDQLGRVAELEPGVWLRRLSHDPAPSVRAAAVRVMAQQSVVDLSDRLDQMARSDPSPAVSYLANFYLKEAKKPAER
jgi:hypothetical protein